MSANKHTHITDTPDRSNHAIASRRAILGAAMAAPVATVPAETWVSDVLNDLLRLAHTGRAS